MSVYEDELTSRVTYLGTGIANLDVAKRYLKSKFRQQPLEPLQVRQGARFYVSVVSGSRWIPVLGPYASHLMALMNRPRGERLIRDAYPNDPRVSFAAFGTCSSPDTLATALGRGNRL